MAAFDGRNPALMAELMAESPRGLIYRDSYMATDQKAGGSNPSWRAIVVADFVSFAATILFIIIAAHSLRRSSGLRFCFISGGSRSFKRLLQILRLPSPVAAVFALPHPEGFEVYAPEG